ncbi:hypothetical protein K438DRAFT_1849430 [Mycena galopus ATCC 62051]|nr:hypothetical protein K438DRAFT_1849430 [Mycena galopus ATCC 62051]
MSTAPARRSSAVLVAAVIFLAIYKLTGFSFAPVSFTPRSSLDRAGDSDVLPVPSETYVISLYRRTDFNYQDMERLRTRLGLRWTYTVAEDSQSPLVRSLRQEALGKAEHPYHPHIFWKTPAPVPVSASDFKPPLTCATENSTLSPYSPRLPEYKILSRSRIACWHSHLSAIQRASTHTRDKAALILEDDRLSSIWSLLPSDWDIVFLGHCWSNESHYPPLGYVAEPSHDFDLPSSTSTTLLHPSHGPLCTHAYLVRSGRLNSFSVVPIVVVQRKVGKSDVMPMAGKGKGSGWRDRLVHGMLVDSDC